MDELIKNSSIQEIADKGTAIYEAIKDKYEPDNKGKFLAIEVENSDVSMGDTAREAIEKARVKNPEKLFYIVKIGFNSTETLAHSLISHS